MSIDNIKILLYSLTRQPGDIMINENDPVYKKHKECPVELRHVNYSGFEKMRMYCVKHNKWLHTLTAKEAQVLLDLEFEPVKQ